MDRRWTIVLRFVLCLIGIALLLMYIAPLAF